eukprot:gene2186-2050_t
MDSQLLQQLTQAIVVIHNPSTSSEYRAQAQNFVDEFKVKGTNIGSYALELLNNDKEDIFRHFGLQLLQHIVKNQWKDLDNSQKENFYATLLNYCSKGVREMTKEVKYVKEKTAAVVVAVLKREWPQRMKEAFNNVKELMNIGKTQCELGILIIKALSEDLSVEFGDDLSAGRKSELRKSFLKQMPEIYKIFYTLFEKCYASYKQNKNDQTNILLITSLLETCISFQDKMKPNDIFENKFHVIWCILAKEEPFRMAAVDCLFLLCSLQNHKLISKERTMEFWNCFGALCSQSIDQTKDLETEYDFHKQLCKTLVAYGIKMVLHLNSTFEELIKSYCQILLKFGNHPSLEIFNSTIKFWIDALTNKDNVLFKFKEFNEILTRLTVICYDKMMKEIGNPENTLFENHPTNLFSQIDFEDIDSFRHFFSQFRSQISTIITSILGFIPELMLSFSFKKVAECLSITKAENKDDVNKYGNCTIQSFTYNKWENASTFLEWVMNFFHKNNKKIIPKNMNMVEEMVKLMLNFKTEDPNIQTRYLHLFKCLSFTYENNKKMFETILDHIFTQMQFVSKNEDQMSEDTKAARQKSQSIFVSIAGDHSTTLLPMLKILVDRAGVMISKNLISQSEASVLFGSLIVISNEMKNYDEQTKFLGYLLNDSMTTWKSQPITEVINSEVLLLKALGVIEEKDENTKKALEEVFQKIQKCLQIFLSATKRMMCDPKKLGYLCEDSIYVYPISTFIHEFFPNILSLIRTINSFYRPEIIQNIPINRRDCLKPLTNENLVLMSSDLKESPENEIVKVSNRLKHLKIQIYGTIGHVFQFADSKFWKNDLLTMLGNSLFAYFEFVDNKTLNDIYHYFLIIAVKHCPSQYQESFLIPILLSIYDITHKRLQAGWSFFIQQSVNPTDIQLKESMIQERILRDLTRQFLVIPLDLTSGIKGKNEISKNSLLKKILNSNVGEVLLMIIISILNYPDTQSVQHSLDLITNLLKHLKIQRYDNIISGELFQGLIRALMSQKEEIHINLIALIQLIYFTYFKKSKYPMMILSALPHVTDHDLKNLNSQFNGTTNEKSRKKLITKLLQPIIGKNSGSFQKPKSILQLKRGGNENDKKKQISLLDISVTDISSLFDDEE